MNSTKRNGGATDAHLDRLVDQILAVIPEACRDRLMPIMGSEVTATWEKLTGRRPHRSQVFRYVADGLHGVNLACVADGRRRMTTPRLIATFLVEAGAARGAGGAA